MRANLLVGKLGLLHQTGRTRAKKIPMRALNSVVFVASKLQNSPPSNQVSAVHTVNTWANL